MFVRKWLCTSCTFLLPIIELFGYLPVCPKFFIKYFSEYHVTPDAILRELTAITIKYFSWSVSELLMVKPLLLWYGQDLGL